jgi:hypothetical protein
MVHFLVKENNMPDRILWDIFVDSNKYRVFDIYNLSLNLEFLELFSSNKALSDSWKVINLKLYNKEKGEDKKPLADFMGGFDIPAISLKAREIMKDSLDNSVEFLPLKTEAGPYFALNVKYLNCLVIDSSIIKRARDGSFLWVEKYVFRWEMLKNVNIFRVTELGLTKLFISAKFKEVYETSYLTGLKFNPVLLAA